MNKLEKVMVFSENPAFMAELCAGGRMLGNAVSAVVIGEKTAAERLDADVCYCLKGEQDRMPEEYAPVIKELIVKENPSLVLIRATKRARVIAASIASSMSGSVITDAVAFNSGGQMEAERMVYGGLAMRTERTLRGLMIATVGAGTFEASGVYGTPKIVEMQPVLPVSRIKRISSRRKESESVDLTSAKRVVVVGRGFAAEKDIAMADDFARAIGAEVGCTRPVAEGEGWMSSERYIGVSSIMIKPEIYVGAGVSGQIQHMIGVKGAKIIVAVNRDKAAPIFKQCDYGIVGDLYKVIPALTKLFKG